MSKRNVLVVAVAMAAVAIFAVGFQKDPDWWLPWPCYGVLLPVGLVLAGALRRR